MAEQKFCGFFGKLPAVGDFVCRSLPPATVAKVDAWLQDGMFQLDQLGKTFYDSYMISSVCFFVIPAGVWSSEALAGFIMPSIDRVGRLFPFIYLESIVDSEQPDLDLLSARLFAVSEIAVHALHDMIGPDELHGRLRAVRSETLSSCIGVGPDIRYYLSAMNASSVWWRMDGSSLSSLQTFNDMDAHSIFSFLYL